ncbi:MAG: winged helix-turn-helix transcriptional regulator [Pirellulaceae bacterium]|nr:winged helix-turn-helix transcriptional regulator [Pirellulaceae bacterium]
MAPKTTPMKTKTKKPQMNPAAFAQAAECLKTLAHPVRLRIVNLLLAGDRYTVCDLAGLCEVSQPQMSDHLRLMQRCGFLASIREGREVYYEVAEPHLADLMNCISQRFGG